MREREQTSYLVVIVGIGNVCRVWWLHVSTLAASWHRRLSSSTQRGWLTAITGLYTTTICLGISRHLHFRDISMVIGSCMEEVLPAAPPGLGVASDVIPATTLWVHTVTSTYYTNCHCTKLFALCLKHSCDDEDAYIALMGKLLRQWLIDCDVCQSICTIAVQQTSQYNAQVL